MLCSACNFRFATDSGEGTKPFEIKPSALVRHHPPCLRSEQGACVDGVAMEPNADVSNELYRKHIDLCDWAVVELCELEGDDEAATQRLNDPRELYGWIRSQLPSSFRWGLLREAQRLGGPYILAELEEHHPPQLR